MEEMRQHDYHTLTEVVITLLKQMEVDKATMKYIINQVDARLHLQLAEEEIELLEEYRRVLIERSSIKFDKAREDRLNEQK